MITRLKDQVQLSEFSTRSLFPTYFVAVQGKLTYYFLFIVVYLQDNTGRLVRQIFMYLPLKKDYPDYYKVITDPIDLSTIEIKIKNNRVCKWVI